MGTTIIEITDDGAPMICPFCQDGQHHMHRSKYDETRQAWDGPTPEVGACWGWDRQSDSLCQCEWRPERLN